MKNGPYELILAPADYPGKRYRGKYAYEHHVVYWYHLGIIPTREEVVHHINGIKRDNRIENLSLESLSKHSSLHHKKEWPEIICGYCSKIRRLKPSVITTRLRNSRWGKIFCSKSCGAKHQNAAYRGYPLGSSPGYPANSK